MSRRVLVTGSVDPDELARAKALAPTVRLKVTELVAYGLTKVLDEIERTGALTLKSRPAEEIAPTRGRRRPHPLFDN